jgi:hypothetical protein
MTESDHLRVRAAKCLRLAAEIKAAADKLKALAVKSLEKASELETKENSDAWVRQESFGAVQFAGAGR